MGNGVLVLPPSSPQEARRRLIGSSQATGGTEQMAVMGILGMWGQAHSHACAHACTLSTPTAVSPAPIPVRLPFAPLRAQGRLVLGPPVSCAWAPGAQACHSQCRPGARGRCAVAQGWGWVKAVVGASLTRVISRKDAHRSGWEQLCERAVGHLLATSRLVSDRAPLPPSSMSVWGQHL